MGSRVTSPWTAGSCLQPDVAAGSMDGVCRGPQRQGCERTVTAMGSPGERRRLLAPLCVCPPVGDEVSNALEGAGELVPSR